MADKRRNLTIAQRRVINNDEVAWEGWDARGRPVVSARYHSGFLLPRGDANGEIRRWAVTRDGGPTEVAEPIESRTT